MAQTVNSKHISLPSTFLSGNITEWFMCFEICSKSNKWNEATQAFKLPTLLAGEAMASWLELSEEEQQDYKLSKRKLIKKLTPLSFATLDEFHARKLRPDEALLLFTQDLKRLLQLATYARTGK